MSLTMRELSEKTLVDVEQFIRTTRIELATTRLRVAGADLKDVRSIRSLRQYLARLLTRKQELTSRQS